MEVLEENPTNWLIMTADGSTATKTKSSDLNQLLYGHDLFGLLDTGNTIWQSQGREDEPSVTIIPDDNAECYTIRVGDYPDLTLGAQRKTDLVDAMTEMYEDYGGESLAPILDLYEKVRSNMIREKVLRPFLDVFGDKVAERDDGWFINGHLLLTYEGDFYHPNNVSRNRSGSVIGQGTSIAAYGVNIDAPKGSMKRNVTVDGEDYRLTNSEVTFLARAMWGIENTPDKR
jgi:hypothetical protein